MKKHIIIALITVYLTNISCQSSSNEKISNTKNPSVILFFRKSKLISQNEQQALTLINSFPNTEEQYNRPLA